MTEAGNAQVTQVQAELQRLMGANDILLDVVGKLRSRLSSVLRTPPPRPDKSEDKVEEKLVPLAENIRDMRQEVDDARIEIVDMLENLQL